VDIAKRDPKLRAIWEKQYSIKLPSFAVGANLIPHDMLAQLHRGEAVVPAAYNPANGGAMGGNGEVVAELRALRQELAELNAAQATNNDSAKITADTLRRVTRGGDAMQTQAFV
jgi:hypothetical protein